MIDFTTQPLQGYAGLNTQCLKNLSESTKKSVLTTDSFLLTTLLYAGYSVKL